MKGLGGVALLEGVCCWEWVLRFQKAHSKPKVSLKLLSENLDVNSQLLLQHDVCLPAASHDDNEVSL